MRALVSYLLLFFCIPLNTPCADDSGLPGYRASYLEQMLDVDYLLIGAQRGHHGPFSFFDKNVCLNKVVLQNDVGNVSLIAGVRQIGLRLGSHLRPRHTAYAVLGSSLEYTGVELWSWTASLSLQPDTRRFDLLRTTRYIGSLHGRYQHCKALGLHFGAYVETGMRTLLVQPIIGVDYTRGSWLYQAIFPIKAGISYVGLHHHIFSLMVRSIYSAIHLHEGLSHHSAIARYKGTGAELRWDLSPNPMWNLWISYGYTVTGLLQVGDRNFRYRKGISFNPAPYGQVGITLAL